MKFSEASKDTQITLLAFGMAGALESVGKDMPDGGKKLVEETCKTIGLDLPTFKRILNEHSEQTRNEVQALVGFDLLDLRSEGA